jgi:MFS family permease
MGLDRSVVLVEDPEQAVNARFHAADRNIRQLTDIEAKWPGGPVISASMAPIDRLGCWRGSSRVRRNEGVGVTSFPVRRAAFRDVFAIGEFRALWASQTLSEVGDRLALVALTLLVYDRTHSPLLSAVAYSAGYVPWVIGGLVLCGLGDRLPRRELMVACDLIRALLVAVMLIPGIPVAGLVGLLYATSMAQAPFEAARSAILPDIFKGERYALAAAVMQTSFRVAIVAGAVAGGIAVAFIGVRPALAVDVATFVVSAALVRFGTKARPAAAASASDTPSAPNAPKAPNAPNAAKAPNAPNAPKAPNALKQLSDGARLVLGDKAIRTLMMLGWLIALYSIPEGIAAPYAATLRGGPAAAGLVIASGQVGAVLAAPVFAKSVGPLTRMRWMGPMAVCTCAVLLLTLFRPGLPFSLAIFALSGTFGIYQIAANTAFVEWVPPRRRAQAFGLANIGVVVGQGAALMLASAAAEIMPPATVIAVGGGLGAVTACYLALRWRDIPPAVGRHTARHLRGPARARGRRRTARSDQEPCQVMPLSTPAEKAA